MNFSEFYLVENKMPPGFSQADIYPAELVLKDAEDMTEEDVDVDEAIDDAMVKDFDISKYRQKAKDYRAMTAKDQAKVADKPNKFFHIGNLCVKGKWIKDEELMAKMSERPPKLLGQNSKMEKSGMGQVFYDLTLPGFMGLFLDEKAKKFKTIVTCPAAGYCLKPCYARKGNFVRFPAPSMYASRTITYLMNDYDGFKNQLINELKEKIQKNTTVGNDVVLRWHDSGDFLSEKYLQMAFEIARATPEITHYAYTKNIPLVNKLESQKPKNFVYRYSFGGKFDDQIDTKQNPSAIIVPTEVFADVPILKRDGDVVIYSPENIELLKKKVAKKYDLNINTVKTSAEMRKIPQGDKLKWNVIVWQGAGDEAAIRKDVLGVYLFEH